MATKKQSPKFTATKIADVVRDLKAAGVAYANGAALTKAAAAAAAANLDPALPMKDRVQAVCALYAEDFPPASNVRTLFAACLTLHAAAQVPTMAKMAFEPATPKNSKTPIVASDIAAALQAPTQALHVFAQQVREKAGYANAKRTPAASAPAAEAPTSQPTTDACGAAIDAFMQWLADPAGHARIVARLAESGWLLSRAKQGRTVTGKATSDAEPAPV